MRYRVTVYFSEIVEVEAKNESEATDKAYIEIKNMGNIMPIPDEYEIECLEEE